MSSEPIRDPITDHLLTPQNAMLMVIDYQPTQVNSIKSMDHDTLVEHVVTVIRTALRRSIVVQSLITVPS